MRNFTLSFLLVVALGLPLSALACSGAGNNKHIGNLTGVDAKNQTFTIQDAETRNRITFIADKEILKGLKGFKGRVMVSYEEDAGGDLKALGVTF